MSEDRYSLGLGSIRVTAEELNRIGEKFYREKRAIVEDALLGAHGRVSVAAEALKVPRTTLRRWIEEYQLAESVANMRLEARMGARVQEGSLKGRVMGRPCRSKRT